MALPHELRTRETGDEHLPGYAELAPANPDPDTPATRHKRIKDCG
jgi:hypothetical protein